MRVTYIKINYNGQKIEIGDCENLKIRDCKSGTWVNQKIDLESSVSRRIFGCQINVMPIDQLLAYKKLLGRDVDKQDVQELTCERRQLTGQKSVT